MTRASLPTFAAVALLLATVAASIPVVLGLLGRVHPAFDSFAHFRWLASVGLLVAASCLLFTRFRIEAAVGGLLGAGALWTTLPGMGFVGADAHAQAGPAYRVLHLNLMFSNQEPASVLSLVGRVKPDVLTLNEVAKRWEPQLDLLASMYPYRAICPSERAIGGVAILSRRPLAPGRPIECSVDGGLAVARVDFGGRWVDVAAIHLHWPWPFRQAAQISELSAQLERIGPDAILAGDLNATTWSAAVATLAESSGSQLVTGIGPTWIHGSLPAFLVDYLGLPIDNLFTKGKVELRSATRLERVGSDHLPILVEFTLPVTPREDELQTAMAEPSTSPAP